MNYIALICARGGSKGVVGKNIRPLGGRPLIGWAIQSALQIDRISRVIVSTDSEQIGKIALEQGAEVPFKRPDELARDTSPEWGVWQHAIEYLNKEKKTDMDGLVVLPPTAPFRNKNDIEKCIDEYEKGDTDIVITVNDSHRSPYFNMIKNDEHGYCSLVLNVKDKPFRRQDVPEVYDMTTVAYVANPIFVLNSNGPFDGKARSVKIPVERALDIDTELDFKIAECLLESCGGE